MADSFYKKLFIILCLLVLITRIAAWSVLANDERRFFDRDTVGYTLPAKGLLEKRQFLISPDGPAQFNTFRSPGYPFWIAVHYAIFGDNHDALVISNLFLFTGTLLLLFKLTDGLFGKRAAFIAAVLLSLDPPSFVSSFKVLSDTAATFFITLFLYLASSYIKDKGRGPTAFYAGLTLAVATFIRPATYYLLPGIICFLAIFHINNKTRRQKILREMALLALPFIVLVGLWQVRNHTVRQYLSIRNAYGQRLADRQGGAHYFL